MLMHGWTAHTVIRKKDVVFVVCPTKEETQYSSPFETGKHTGKQRKSSFQVEKQPGSVMEIQNPPDADDNISSKQHSPCYMLRTFSYKKNDFTFHSRSSRRGRRCRRR
ncbi:Uncharacterized protein TCM_000273 [Theobroma cacao]|uniref:Uncharacterized protein n=1 Tax=Theobroma cacao TaxID=3641 RepID=A0A061DGT6_THECC|nr:Uncharacterized protein TCM_000273 [Theobroma cacao]